MAKEQRGDFILSEQLQSEIILQLRGRRSQEWLNRKMKLKPKQVHRWETLRAAISWPEFLKLCSALNVPISKAFHEVPGYYGDIESVADLIQFFAGHLSHVSLAKRMGTSRSVVQRWAVNKGEPSLLQVLSLISFRYSLDSFFSKIAPAGTKPSKRTLAQLSKEDLQIEMPWLPAIISLLDHEEYRDLKKHQRGYFAKVLKISQDQEDQTLAEMLNNGIISFVEGKYRNLSDFKNSSTSGNQQAARIIRNYWTQRSLALINGKNESGKPIFWPQCMASVDQEAFEKIKERLVVCWNEIDEIAKSSAKENIVALIAIQCIDVSSLPAEE